MVKNPKFTKKLTLLYEKLIVCFYQETRKLQKPVSAKAEISQKP